MVLLTSMRASRAVCRFSLFSFLLAFALAPAVGFAQSELRSTFPGRRVGGGTRGECSARLLAHLVPANSIYAPGRTLQVGLLEGPTANPKPIEIHFRRWSGAPSDQMSEAMLATSELPASTAGITLISLEALNAPAVWESAYRCGDDESTSSDPLAFVQTASPPALSLLVRDSEADDLSIQKALASLRTQCGASVSTETFARIFSLGDVIDADWPAELPVRCPS